MTDNPRHDGAPLAGSRSKRVAPTSRPGARPAPRTARTDWLTGHAAELLLSGGRVPREDVTDAAEAATADRLAGLLSAAAGRPAPYAEGPLAGPGFALDPEREEAALAAFRAARATAPAPAVRAVPVRRDRIPGGSARLRLPGLRSIRVATAAMAAVLALGGVAAAVAAGTGRLPLPGAGSGAPAVSSTPGPGGHGGGAAPATTAPPRGSGGAHGTTPSAPSRRCTTGPRQDTDRWYGRPGLGAPCAADRPGNSTGNNGNNGNTGNNGKDRSEGQRNGKGQSKSEGKDEGKGNGDGKSEGKGDAKDAADTSVKDDGKGAGGRHGARSDGSAQTTATVRRGGGGTVRTAAARPGSGTHAGKPDRKAAQAAAVGPVAGPGPAPAPAQP